MSFGVARALASSEVIDCWSSELSGTLERASSSDAMIVVTLSLNDCDRQLSHAMTVKLRNRRVVKVGQAECGEWKENELRVEGERTKS